MDDNQVITKELLQDQNWLASWMIATAKQEGFQGTLDRGVFDAAFRKLDGTSSYDPSKTPELKGDKNSTTPGSSEEAEGNTEKPFYSSAMAAINGLTQGFDMLRKATSY
jgi:hypothetical protein